MPKAFRRVAVYFRAAAAAAMAAFLTACASPPAPDEPAEQGVGQKGKVDVIGHHCDGGQGIDSLALHVEGPGEVVIRWSNESVCGKPA